MSGITLANAHKSGGAWAAFVMQGVKEKVEGKVLLKEISIWCLTAGFGVFEGRVQCRVRQ